MRSLNLRSWPLPIALACFALCGSEMAGATPPVTVSVSAKGVNVTGGAAPGGSADIAYPATNLIYIFGAPSRTWTPTGGVPVTVTFFDPIGVSIRQPATAAAKDDASVQPMLEFRCITDGFEFDAKRAFPGTLHVHDAPIHCGMTYGQVRNALATAHQPAELDGEIHWLRTFVGAYKVSFKFGSTGDTPPPTQLLDYVMVEKKSS